MFSMFVFSLPFFPSTSIAQELTNEPNLIFLDEPTTGLGINTNHHLIGDPFCVSMRKMYPLCYGMCRIYRMFTRYATHAQVNYSCLYEF